MKTFVEHGLPLALAETRAVLLARVASTGKRNPAGDIVAVHFHNAGANPVCMLIRLAHCARADATAPGYCAPFAAPGNPLFLLEAYNIVSGAVERGVHSFDTLATLSDAVAKSARRQYRKRLERHNGDIPAVQLPPGVTLGSVLPATFAPPCPFARAARIARPAGGGAAPQPAQTSAPHVPCRKPAPSGFGAKHTGVLSAATGVLATPAPKPSSSAAALVGGGTRQRSGPAPRSLPADTSLPAARRSRVVALTQSVFAPRSVARQRALAAEQLVAAASPSSTPPHRRSIMGSHTSTAVSRGATRRAELVEPQPTAGKTANSSSSGRRWLPTPFRRKHSQVHVSTARTVTGPVATW